MGDIIDLHVHYYTDGYLAALEGADTTRITRREHDSRLVCRWRSGWR